MSRPPSASPARIAPGPPKRSSDRARHGAAFAGCAPRPDSSAPARARRMPSADERARERADDVGEAPRLHQRKALRGDHQNFHRQQPQSLSIISCVMRQTPSSVRRKRRASSSGSSPTTSLSGMTTPRSTTTRVSRACRPIFDVGKDDRVGEAAVGVHQDAGEEQRLVDLRAGDDAAAADERARRHAAPAVLVMDELCRRRDFGIGPDRPLAVVEIEGRREVGEVDIGLPERIDRADVAPVGLGLGAGAHAALGEAVRDGLAVLDDAGDDILAEIVAASSDRPRRHAGGRSGTACRRRRCPCWRARGPDRPASPADRPASRRRR